MTDGDPGTSAINAGGGGGAVGRIRINTLDASALSGILSPALSTAAASSGPLGTL